MTPMSPNTIEFGKRDGAIFMLTEPPAVLLISPALLSSEFIETLEDHFIIRADNGRALYRDVEILVEPHTNVRARLVACDYTPVDWER
ncbi:hypothetical protein TVVG_00053 [Tetraselmis viridis virus SI1]|uniref:hypothetical protein n=1 Tax=Tetraselmis viridis virus S20 TaxID=754070 RepID=UPI0002C08151|nr:hypothetical protein TVGG_00019 [Tetraselmis viridis virus S20]AGH31347.1 hypothetical protein TVGG_00019 [Tetraselmis viridis virus S20]AGH31435.1 hypothetical protein TVVG_00053 [Tetraselmis viridis virus SI1]